ncbi:CDP-diacylglycerol--serine O-phosphatidyltransferase [Cognatiyoonia sp. IB215446]|uniref:CDP-diacylglycerol--serine O-phosphatidyltransferase n=1 Tax=Cognatiyoonia sp. IB215446 TaxID=3097355 RepID=UPI002A0C4789|nr:CDP-diacylglycerol--serine O-phosphatidyltransferase [Cognatiyoonia sp. IB215446]MDX8349701.1 CDP-diacylglycerol--serine O-phosphatidyltransferase [Cognatiyoonia sp. IB215446]
MVQQASPRSELPIVTLLPNLVTLAAICAGLTAIRFGFQGNYEQAVLLVLLACVFDAVDGRLARLLKCESKMGAELDSLADFLNFGVAAPLLLYLFALQDMRSAGWITVLVFALCCVIRLARFNVTAKNRDGERQAQYFIGVPAPAGAMLVLMPMFISFLFANESIIPPIVVALWTAIIGVLMISTMRTYSFKMLTVSRENVPFVLLGAMVIVAALLTYVWVTLVAINLVYIAGVIWAWRRGKLKD